MRVLIVEDEADVGDLAVFDYDMVVLDLGLPGMDGFEVCRRWRAKGGHTPILMLTARGSLSARVAGLDVGADDYLSKPFAIEELLARMRALARRPTDALDPVLKVNDLALDPSSRTVTRAGSAIALTAREFALLEYLLRTFRRVVSRAQILEHVWDDNFDPVGNVVDVLVGRVRRKVDRVGMTPLIHTVRGVGYLLSDQAPADAD